MDNSNIFWKEFYKGFKEFGGEISSIINFIFLSLIYFLAVSLAAIMLKRTKTGKIKNSYWIDLNLTKKKMEEYYKQF